MGGVPVTVLGGYLGAGKTTIVNALLMAPHGLRIAVVVNDFGEVNIDAALVADRAARRIDLTNGCACCVVGDSLGDACFELAEASPPFDRIVIEASGVADPATVASWASIPGLRLDGVVVAVDPDSVERHLADRLVGATVERQIAVADLVVVTRADAVDADRIARAVEVVRRHRRDVPVVASRFDAVPVAALVDLAVLPTDRTLDRASTPGHGHRSATWCPSGWVDLDRLGEALRAFPGLVRAKGLVRVDSGACVVVHLVGARVTHERSTYDGEPVVVGIGVGEAFDPSRWAATLERAAITVL